MLRLFFFSLTLFTLIFSGTGLAQELPLFNETQEEPTQAGSLLEPKNKAVLQTLDKVTGRTGTATVDVGETVKLGTLFLTVQTCRKAPPIEQPEAAAFIQVWQPIRDENGKMAPTPESEWVFSGWMYESSPAVSAMDHPVYDVWVIDCRD